MPTHRLKLAAILPLIFLFFFPLSRPHAQEISPNLYSGLRWRLIGPFRGGRVTCVAGVPQQPNVYYFGTPGGGLWKTTDAGQVWEPIFDQERVAPIGSVAVSASDPNIIYAGTGEFSANGGQFTQGQGVYKSTDGGATWRNVGLRETHIIPSIILDEHNPDVALVAAAGDFASGENRGVFKTQDGGKTWEKTLFRDSQSRVVDMSVSADAPRIVYATLLRGGVPLGPPQPATAREQNAFIYKSTDQGSTWEQLKTGGLPAEPMGRTGIAVAPGSGGSKIFLIVSQGLFYSEDGGTTWSRRTQDPRVVSNGYFGRVFVDPTNADIVYVAQTSMYRSTDGGRTFEAFAGAPSGDDFHVLWINPLNHQNMIFGVDQGAIISADGGKTWSSWYNQPTGQFYHVTTDNQFPYFVYGAQQDSGTMAVASRSDYGEITDRDWAPVGGFERAFIAPDPLHPNWVYIGGWYGSILRYDKVTGHIVHLFVRSSRYRTGTPPVVFSPQDPHTLYVGAQYVLKSTDGGSKWQEISPDLTQSASGSINVLAVSTVKAGEIWAGTGNGVVQMTSGDGSWKNVTPRGLTTGTLVRELEASHHDPAEAYVVFAHAQELHPLIYRTRDSGATWQPITNGISDSGSAYVVREDPERKGLLYAGTGNAVYVSFDDGDHWQTLQLNLPTATITDLAIHGNDLVAATFGRAFWILDNIVPLRHLDAGTAQQDVFLFSPSQTIRVRWDINQDTPLPMETPAGKNPPDGAIIDYYLKSPPEADLKLTIYDSQGTVVREYSSAPPAVDNTPANVPSYWFAPPPQLPKAAGLNRFAWDLRYPAPKTLDYSYYGNLLDYKEYDLPDHAVPGETPREQPLGPFVAPGKYVVALKVGEKVYRRDLTVTADPRVHATAAELQQQADTAKVISAQMAITSDGFSRLAALRKAIAGRQKALAEKSDAKDAVDNLKSLDDKVTAVEIGGSGGLGVGPINRELGRLGMMVESGDSAPSDALRKALQEYCTELQKRLDQWRESNQVITMTNSLLQRHGLNPLPESGDIPRDAGCGR